VQSEFGITIEPEEITPANFDSMNKLIAFIDRKQVVNAQSA
jgi:acyl carrier protein